MSSGLGARLGSQLPRIENAPPWVSSGGDEACELATMAGLAPDPWQRRVLQVALGQDSFGRFSSPEVGIVVPRQNGKSVIIYVAILAAIYLRHSEVVYTAHLMSTSRKVRERIQRLIMSNPDLAKEVKQVRISNEEQSIELHSPSCARAPITRSSSRCCHGGPRVDFVARTATNARGWSGDQVFMDEAFALTADQVGALQPITFTRPNWQLWYASSAGKPASHALRRIRERGMAADPGLAYFEWSADEDAFRADPIAGAVDEDLLAQANPALGLRITPRTLALAQRSMDPVEYAREVLGIWDDPRGEAIIDPAVWARLADPGSMIARGVVFSLDASPGLRSGAIVAAGAREDGITHVEITGRDGALDHRLGVEWMVARAVELQEQWNPVVWMVDASGPAGALLTDLRDAGIEPVCITGRELGQACGAFLAAAVAPGRDQLRHVGQRALSDALRAAKWRDVGDGARAFGRRASEQDISPLMAAGLAFHGFAVYGAAYDLLESIR